MRVVWFKSFMRNTDKFTRHFDSLTDISMYHALTKQHEALNLD